MNLEVVSVVRVRQSEVQTQGSGDGEKGNNLRDG